MRIKTILISVLTAALFCAAGAFSPAARAETTGTNTAVTPDMRAKVASLQVPFVQNEGQIADARVKFYAKTFAGTVFVTSDGLTYALGGGDGRNWALREEFAAAMPIIPVGYKPSPTKVNSFVGSDSGAWRSGLPAYEEVTLGEVYDRINISLRAYGNNVEKIFTVSSGGDPTKIKLKVTGAEGLSVNALGELELATGLGTVKMTRPTAYQEIGGRRVDIEVAYALKEGGYGFQVGEYDQAHPLAIDPLLASTFLGGEGMDNLYAMALDPSGNVFVAGITNSTEFPTVTGATYDTVGDSSNYDVFISKLKGDLSGPLLASTYFGGSSTEINDSVSLAVDSGGNVYVTGNTLSTDFPITPGAKQDQHSPAVSQGDVFVSKFNGSLSELLASTYLGGDKNDTAYALALDSSGHVFVAGTTSSSGFPTSGGALDTTFGGTENEGFVTRFNSDLSETDFKSTLIGGSKSDNIYCLYIDPAGNVYVGGDTKSYLAEDIFPLTGGAFRNTWTNTSYGEGFVAKLSNDLTGSASLLASTLLGCRITAYALCVDNTLEKNIYVTGSTRTYLPVTDGAYATTPGGGTSADAFIMKLTNNLAGNGVGSGTSTQPQAATYLGGDKAETGRSIAMDASGNVVVAGETFSAAFPVLEGAFDTQLTKGEAFITKMKPDLTGPLQASTFFGGDGNEYANAMSVDSSGNIYIAGYIVQPFTNFHITTGAYDETPPETTSTEGFVARLTGDLLLATPDNTPPVWPANSELTCSNLTQTGLTLSWLNNQATDDSGYVNYRLYQNGALLATVSSATYEVTGLSVGQYYTFKVEAGDAAGNWTTDGPGRGVTTMSPPDAEPPTWTNGSLTAIDVTQVSLTLTWSGAADNIGVTVYKIFKDGVEIGTVQGATSYGVTGLTAGAQYTFRLEAGDAGGNWSAGGPSATVTTPTYDTTPPVWPAGSALWLVP